MIVIDDDLLDELRRKQRCEFCGLRARCQPHHYHARGMGGGSRLDIRENLIALCPECHGKAHGLKITRADIMEAIARREKKTPRQCQEVIWDMLAKKKGIR